MKGNGDRTAQRLKERNFKLNTLLEVSSAINNLESDAQLFEVFLDVLTKTLGLGRGILISNINGWVVNLRFGELGSIDEAGLIEKCFSFHRITVLNDHPEPILSSFDVILPIEHKSKPISYLLLGDFEGERIEVSPIIRHLPFIQTLTNLIVVAQENKRLFEENLKQVAFQRELELASRVQNLMIPDSFPVGESLRVHAHYFPHLVVGGDYYDFFKVSDDEYVICIADVSGKGMSAALLMSNFQAMMHAMLDFDQDVERLVRSLNERVLKNAKGERLVTAFIGIYHEKERMLTYINAGHQPVILKRGKEIKELTLGTTVLGVFEELPHLHIGKEIMESGSVILCFTDGLCETENERGEEFGIEPLKKILVDGSEKSIQEITAKIMNEIREFRGSSDFSDDLALLGVRFV